MPGIQLWRGTAGPVDDVLFGQRGGFKVGRRQVECQASKLSPNCPLSPRGEGWGEGAKATPATSIEESRAPKRTKA
jgi:hypothetical protein